MDQICPKSIVPIKNRKSEHHHWILHIPICVGTKFQPQLIFWLFGPNLPKNSSSTQKKKWTASLNFAYSNYSRYQISASTDNFYFLNQICPRRVFLITNRKSEHYHSILHVRISVSTKFLLKLIILFFWAKFAQKENFQPKKVKVNIIIEFCIFELV